MSDCLKTRNKHNAHSLDKGSKYNSLDLDNFFSKFSDPCKMEIYHYQKCCWSSSLKSFQKREKLDFRKNGNLFLYTPHPRCVARGDNI